MPPSLALPPELEPHRTRYLRNLTALYRSDPELAARVDALPFAQCPQLEFAANELLTARLPSDAGMAIYLHSRRDPAAEGQRFIQSHTSADSNELLANTKQQVLEAAADDPLTFVLFGLGLGYAVAAFESAVQNPTTIVFEPRIELIKAACCVQDFTASLAANRLVFLTQADADSITKRLKSRNTTLMLGTRLIVAPFVRQIDAAFHSEAKARLLDFIAHTRTQFITLLRNAELTFRNVAYNLPAYLNNPGIDAFANVATGRPAIVVSAGPSLARHIARLKAVQDRAIIIATQTVLRPLLNAGITPHFVTSLDYHEISRQYFVDLTRDTKCILIAEPKVTWHVPENFPGQMHLLHSSIADKLLRTAAPPRAKLSPGSTVAHLAFYFAQHLGCDPIIFLGQDLAYSDGLYYAPGMPIEDIWRPELSRFETIENKQWERIARMRPILKTVPGVDGKPVHTDAPMFSYLQQFEAEFRTAPQRLILAGPSGAAIAGTERMDWRDIEQSLIPGTPHNINFREIGINSRNPASQNATTAKTRDMADDKPNPLRQAGGSDAKLKKVHQTTEKDAYVEELSSRLKETAAIAAISEKSISVLESLTTLLDNPQRFNAKLEELNALRSKLGQYEAMYNIIISVAQRAELCRIDADRRIGGDESETEDAATAKRRLRRDRAFIEEVLAGCEFVTETLQNAIKRLQEHAS